MKKTSIFKISVALMGIVLLFTSCYEEEITIGSAASDYFYVERDGASMFTLVRGNTESKKFLLLIHGGPGDSGMSYSDNYMRSHIESRYAVVYYDQRDAGSSQGNINGEYLTVDNMAEDIRGLISVLKKRYGQDIDIYLMGHSFGGLLSSAFMTADGSNDLVKGWIFVDGAQDYSLNDSLTSFRLIQEGEKQISMGNHIEEWTEILNFCRDHKSNFNLEESMQVNTYARKGQSYIEDIKDTIYGKISLDSPEFKIPLTANFGNQAVNYELIKDIIHASYSDVLYKVTVPVLAIFGEYDFICPKELGDELISKISSEDKEMVIIDKCTHSPMKQDPDFFYSKVVDFIEKH